MEWKMTPKIVFCLLLGALFLSGCGSDTLDFKIRYQEISGLRKDDRVLFEERQIGNVKDVKHTSQGDYLVDVSISKGFANDITEHSRFYVPYFYIAHCRCCGIWQLRPLADFGQGWEKSI
jgi:hypothetical protein